MRFSLRTTLEIITAIAVIAGFAVERHFWYQAGQRKVRDEFQHTGRVATHADGIVVPLDNRVNLHVLPHLHDKPGTAVVEVWDCQVNWRPNLIRSIDVDTTWP